MRAGLPRDPAQWIALALSLAALLAGAWLLRRGRSSAAARPGPAPPRPGAAGLDPPPRPGPAPRPSAPHGFAVAAALGLAAALISAAYVAVYLRGGPRIIDATSYWLEARAMAAGHLAWPLGEPEASVLGRFLVRSDAAGDAARRGAAEVAVIFPPGYPALLALGFLAGAPLAVGPLLAAALTLATYDLAARFAPAAPASAGSGARLPLAPLLAALFSALCAALRYHTADTMSHGLAALCFTVALASARRALDEAAPAAGAPRWWRDPAVRAAALAGVAAGWLAATRPPSALALAAALLVALLPERPPGSAAAGPRDAAPRPSPRLGRLAAALAIGAVPGLALLAAHQRAATGAFASSQGAYYAVSDGPPGCFRYGFGEGVGCLFEHGDFVRHNLAEGYGFLAAAGTTLRRLKLHLVDALNAEPLSLFVIAGAAIALRRPRSRALAIAPLLQIAAYAPFYFDGNYPGGGARFFADVLPVEHALAALACAAIAERAGSPAARGGLAGRLRALLPVPFVPAALFAAALPLAGFAFRAGFDHAALRDREGGLPMFDPAAVARAGVARGLVFVDTDHGFNLGFDPAPGDVAVLRYRGDAIDRMAWEARGRPPAYRYRFAIPDGGGLASVSLAPLAFDAAPPREALIEGESLWPPRAQRGAWAAPEHAGGTCASGGRLLAVHAAASGEAVVRVGLPAPWLRGARISPRVAVSGDGAGELVLAVDGAPIHVWRVEPAAPGAPGAPLTCAELPPHPIPEDAVGIELSIARANARQHGKLRRDAREAPRDEAGAAAPRAANAARIRVETAAESAPGGPDGPAAGGLFALDAVAVAGGNSVDR
ncbi:MULTISPECIES: hypothetical protein [Sorangium]|uniref:Uncharacterized protein n=1 Tax=Sorangium cellulosum TaxID=56 RepID=A0A4P2QFQ2_SORCE|nr:MULTISPECIES: hypothetical protein [Sorangium]AUX28700.1 hypothetical protein SOCE836_007810 [Sorangium cellulosum]WCQ88097.1 hypothetical protein NQZ70_00769 [Sorangium sp. Soce836]